MTVETIDVDAVALAVSDVLTWRAPNEGALPDTVRCPSCAQNLLPILNWRGVRRPEVEARP